jgi:hypothetical protein
MIARSAAVKLCDKKSFLFNILLKVQPFACGRDEGRLVS